MTGTERNRNGRRPDPTGVRADDPLDDALGRAIAGDEQGFVELWRALQPPLLRYLAVRGNESPDDLAAETWLQVVRDLERFAGDAADFRAWLFTVARHRAVDEGRARAVRPVVALRGEWTTAAGDVLAPAPSAEASALERVSTQTALAMVAALPAEQAEMVMLRVVAGLDVSAVARIVGKKPGTVRVGVHRALRTLSRDARALAAQEVV